MQPLLYDKWIFRGYKSLEDFETNQNFLFESTTYPFGQHSPKYIWILTKYFFEGGKKNSQFWDSFENSKEFKNCVLIVEDHEESCNFDHRWIEVMRRRRKGIYIKDACPNYILDTSIRNPSNGPIIIPGYFPVYDKWNGKPFSLYDFKNPKSKYKHYDNNRDIDVLFIGKNTARRSPYVQQILSAAKNLKLNYQIHDNLVSFEDHIDLMRRSKICYQFMAIGYRSSREWEAMLNGSLLISDDRTTDYINTSPMIKSMHFVRYDPNDVEQQMKYWLDNQKERESISKCGFELAWNVWSDCRDAYMPSRLLAAYKIKQAKW